MSTFHETAQRTAGHIRQPFTLQEIADQIETGEYNAELMLQHLLLCTDSLQRENAALRDVLRGKVDRLERENAALREDKERLDSGMIRLRAYSEWGNEWCLHTRLDLRAAIDAARAKEAKP